MTGSPGLTAKGKGTLAVCRSTYSAGEFPLMTLLQGKDRHVSLNAMEASRPD